MFGWGCDFGFIVNTDGVIYKMLTNTADKHRSETSNGFINLNLLKTRVKIVKINQKSQYTNKIRIWELKKLGTKLDDKP